jgi:hypothetical protein
MRAAAVWARAEIRGRRGSLIAVALLIGVMAAAAMTGLAGARRTLTSFERFREVALAHDVFANIDDTERERLDRIAELPMVAAAATGSLYPAFVDLESSYDIGIVAPSSTSFGSTIDRGRYLKGRPPRADRVDEVAVNVRAAEALDADVGDRVSLGTFTPDQIARIEQEFSGRLEGPELRLRVTGIVRHPADLESDAANVLLFASPAFERAHATDVGRFQAVGLYRLRGGLASFDDFARSARPLLGSEGEVGLESAGETQGAVDDALDAIGLGLVLIGAAAAAVGLVAGGQMLARQLSAGAADQPALATLGLTRAERTAAVVLTALPVAAGAAVVGLLIAVAASPLTPVSLGREAEPDPGVAFDAAVHLGGAGITALFVVVGAALVGALAARRPLTAPTQATRPTLGTRAASALRLSAPATTGIRMALEPGSGRTSVPARSALAGAVLAVAGLVGALTFGSSLDRLVTTPARYGIPWDFQPDLFEDSEQPPHLDRDAASVGLLSLSSVSAEGRPVTGYAITRVKGDPSFQILSGRSPVHEREVALGRDLLDRLDRSVGDSVRFDGADGPRTLRIVGTALSPSLDDDPIGSAALLTPEGLAAVAGADVALSNTLIWWRDGVDPAAARARYAEAMPDLVSVYANPQPPAEIVNLERVHVLPRVFAAFVGLIGVAAVLHAVATSIRRRRSDLAVLRALGFLRGQVRAAITWQASTIGIVGLVVGIPLGLVVGRWAWILVADGVGVANDPRVPTLAVLLAVPLTMLVVSAVGVPLGARVARQPAAAALRAE